MTDVPLPIEDEPAPERNTSFARVSRDSFVYSFGSVAGKAIGLLMLPILTRLLSVDEFGRLDILSTMVSALISALLLGLDHSTLRLFFDLPEGQGARGRVAGHRRCPGRCRAGGLGRALTTSSVSRCATTLQGWSPCRRTLVGYKYVSEGGLPHPPRALSLRTVLQLAA